MMPENTSRIGCVLDRPDSTLAAVLTTSGLRRVQRANTCVRNSNTLTHAWPRRRLTQAHELKFRALRAPLNRNFQSLVYGS